MHSVFLLEHNNDITHNSLLFIMYPSFVFVFCFGFFFTTFFVSQALSVSTSCLQKSIWEMGLRKKNDHICCTPLIKCWHPCQRSVRMRQSHICFCAHWLVGNRPSGTSIKDYENYSSRSIHTVFCSKPWKMTWLFIYSCINNMVGNKPHWCLIPFKWQGVWWKKHFI